MAGEGRGMPVGDSMRSSSLPHSAHLYAYCSNNAQLYMPLSLVAPHLLQAQHGQGVCKLCVYVCVCVVAMHHQTAAHMG